MVYTLTRASVVLTASIVSVMSLVISCLQSLEHFQHFWHQPRLHFVINGLTLIFENLSVSLLHL
jgi:hypothetical protein